MTPPGGSPAPLAAPRRGERLAVALASGCAVAALAYAVVRLSERALLPEANPAIVIWSDRSSFAWRAAISGYFGGAGAFGASTLLRRAPGATVGGLSCLVLAAAVALVAQAVLVP